MPIVCVLDRGCNMGIPFLSSFAQPGFTTGGGTGNGAEISSADTHGTYCAGIVAHTYTTNGGNPGDLRIMPVAIGTLTVPEVVQGINWAIDHGAQIISLSQEFPASWPTADINAALDRALNQNIVVCVATGNTNNAIRYPATHSGAMAVGACTSNVGTANRVTHTHTGGAWGSNFGSQLSVVALGLNVDTSYLGGGYLARFERTSAATPQVAALAALILNKYPSLSHPDIRAVIEANADHPSGGRNNDVGYGRINVSSTLTALNNDLSALSVSQSSLDPAFKPSTLNYGVDVGVPTDHVTITATKFNPQAIMLINGSVTVGTGIPTGQAPIPLSGPGTNTMVTITVVAPYGNSKAYTIIVSRGFASPPPPPGNLRVS